jgi:ABC-type hemin transport system substrate-binding protein
MDDDARFKLVDEITQKLNEIPETVLEAPERDRLLGMMTTGGVDGLKEAIGQISSASQKMLATAGDMMKNMPDMGQLEGDVKKYFYDGVMKGLDKLTDLDAAKKGEIGQFL